MNRILIAAIAAFAFAGAAAAQQAPVLSGSYSANVLNSYNGTADAGLDIAGQASIAAPEATTSVDAQYNLLWNDNYSGR